MSGGHYDHKYFKLEELADDIERDFLKDGKYMAEDWSTRKMVEHDRLEDANDEQREEILKEIRSLQLELRRCSFRARELEWYMSGDTGVESYLERLTAGLNNIK